MASLARAHGRNSNPSMNNHRLQYPTDYTVEGNAGIMPVANVAKYQIPGAGPLANPSFKGAGGGTLMIENDEEDGTELGKDGMKAVGLLEDNTTNKHIDRQRHIMPISTQATKLNNNTKKKKYNASNRNNEGLEEKTKAGSSPGPQRPITPSLEKYLESTNLKFRDIDGKESQSNNVNRRQHDILKTFQDDIGVLTNAVNSQQSKISSLGPISTPKRPIQTLLSMEEENLGNTEINLDCDQTRKLDNHGTTNKTLSYERSILLDTESEGFSIPSKCAQVNLIERDKNAIVGTGIGPREFKRGNRRGWTDSSRNNRIHTPHTPPWTPRATTSETKIEDSILLILGFIKSVSREWSDGPEAERDKQFKVFLDANKDIVRAWRSLEGGICKGRPKAKMAESIDCIHAILVAWGSDGPTSGAWVNQAMELTELCLAFAREWESITAKDLGVAKWLGMRQKTNGVLEEYTITETDESMEYIHPGTIGINKNDLFKGDCHAEIKSSTMSLSPKTTPPQISQTSQAAPSTPKTSTKPTNTPVTHNNPYPSSPAAEENLHLHQRLSNIEDHLRDQQNSEQTVIRVLEMQRLLIQDITDAIFGNVVKPDPKYTEKKIIAKRTGLLMMNMEIADDKQKKISALEEENSKVKTELENLKVAYQAKSHKASETIDELKKVTNSIRAHLPMHLESEGKNWADEALDGAMEMYWPQGDPSQVGDGGLIEENMPGIYHAGRGQGSGSGVGSCVVM